MCGADEGVLYEGVPDAEEVEEGLGWHKGVFSAEDVEGDSKWRAVKSFVIMS
ncbi:hypothetical protein IJI28_02855 [Candidatus Saccharibacteria bacterium]|nr:hypothetical protein [Candidatus Saccharibacteria bacterium]